MARVVAFLLACGAALLAPWLGHAPVTAEATPEFPGWPSELDGRTLRKLPDSADELRFYAQLPLRHGRFSDGQRVVLLRWAGAQVDGFHLAGQCFQAFGFTLTDSAVQTSHTGRTETCFDARRADEVRHVCEHIRDGQGRIFPDAESFHLARLLGTAVPPYLGVSIVD